MDCSNLIKQYIAQRHRYESLTLKFAKLIEELLLCESIKVTIESRTKEIDSFTEKIKRTGKFYSDLSEVTDLSGIRIISYSRSDVDKIAEIICREFTVDLNRSVNKITELDPDRFGYLSQHYIVKVGSSRQNLPEWSNINDLWTEIQVRTILQHAWASVEHFLVYKNTVDAPTSLRRGLYRLSALFELADEELDRLIQERTNQIAEYQDTLNRNNAKVEINIDSLNTYIQNSEELRSWSDLISSILGIKVIHAESVDLSSIVQFSRLLGLNSLEDIDKLLVDSHGWGEYFLSIYHKEIVSEFGLKFENKIMFVTTILILLMAGSNVENLTTDTLVQGLGWGSIQAKLLISNASEARHKFPRSNT